MLSKYEKVSDLVLLTLLVFCFVPFFYLYNFTFPCGDDVLFGTGLKNPKAQWKLNGGRMTAYYLMHISPVMNLTYFRLMPPLTIIFSIISTYKVIPLLSSVNIKPIPTLNICLAFHIVLITIMPSIPSQFYWYTGFVVYYIPFLFIGYFIYFLLYTKEKNVLSFLFLTILNIIICFWHELYCGLLIMILSTIIFEKLILRKQSFKKGILSYLLQLVVSIVSTFFVFNSPGNQTRLSRSTAKQDNFRSLGDQLNNLYDISLDNFILSWMQDPILVIILLLVLIKYFLFQHRSKQIDFVKILMVAIIYVLICIFSFLPASVAYDGVWWRRIYNPNAVLFTSLLFLFILRFGNAFTPSKINSRLTQYMQSILSNILLLLLISTVVSSKNNIKQAYQDISSGKVSLYKAEMEERINILTYDIREVSLKKVSIKPRSIFQEEMLNAPTYINGYKRYYRKSKINVIK